jgi:thymidylate kinase
MIDRENNIPIIALDGNHRVGKGTQIELLMSGLIEAGRRPIMLRGDGSRPGTGETEGDPHSSWWQGFKDYAKSFENEYDAWRIGARTLLSEAAITRTRLPANAVILFDRSVLSRTQMTIKEGLIPSIASAYMNSGSDTYNETIFQSLYPDVQIYLAASPEKLLERLAPDDEKYAFRHENIRSSSKHYDDAFDHLSGQGDAIFHIDGTKHPTEVQDAIRDVIIQSNILQKKDA